MHGRKLRTLVTVLWMALQVAAFAGSPYMTCCDQRPGSGSPACCDGKLPGQLCPMHAPEAAGAAGDTSPALRCVCRVSNAALAVAALLGHSLLPAEFVLPLAPVSSRLAATDAAVLLSASPADTPPPRA